MSCPCNPKTGPEFDPDREGPCAADLEKFGGDDDGDYFFEDELDPTGAKAASAPSLKDAWIPLTTGSIVVAFLLYFIF